MDTPNIFDVVHMPGSFEDLPKPVDPYYVLARNGLYVYKRGPLGTSLLPTKDLPTTLRAMPDAQKAGWLDFTADRVPLSVMNTALAFFRQVYRNWQAEAEVLLTYNDQADPKYRLFVPYQRVSGAHVYSIYDPSNLQPGWQVIGSIHSHCMFSAFHSGTDINDAKGFPGLHITMGMVLNTPPQFDSMVMLNGVRFDFKIESVAEVEGIGTTEIAYPNWWMRYVARDEATAAKIAEKIKNVPQEDIDRFLGKHRQLPTVYRSYGSPSWTPGAPYQGSQRGAWDGYDFDDASWAEYYNSRLQSLATKPKPPVAATEPGEHDRIIYATDSKPGRILRGQGLRWSHELSAYVEKDQLDDKGNFKDFDAACAATVAELARIDLALRDYGIKLWFDLEDPETGMSLVYDENGEIRPATNLDDLIGDFEDGLADDLAAQHAAPAAEPTGAAS